MLFINNYYYDFSSVVKNKKAKQLFKIYLNNNHNILLKYLGMNMFITQLNKYKLSKLKKKILTCIISLY